MSSDEAKPVLSRRGIYIAGLTIAVAAVALVVFGITTRKVADARLGEWTEKQALPVVAVEKPDTESRQMSIELPGRLEAYSQAQIYARVSGYIKEWKADIGMPVKAGQLLAEIDAPDLDQQIMQAEATLASARANAVLAKATLERGQSLIQSGSVSKQDLDQRVADFSNRQGLARAAQADLDRMRVLEKYKRITAPFDGLVTARATDVGALVNAGSSGGPALFVVSDVDKLRVYVNVPQAYVPSIRIGTKARLSVPEYQGKFFQAAVEASAQSVDVASGTTRMQLVVDNASHALMTGAFVTVRLDLSRQNNAINIPAGALIFNQDGLRVATVGATGRVVLKAVTVSRDFGKVVEIGSGLDADDDVIVTPPDGVATGDIVRVAKVNPEAGDKTAISEAASR